VDEATGEEMPSEKPGDSFRMAAFRLLRLPLATSGHAIPSYGHIFVGLCISDSTQCIHYKGAVVRDADHSISSCAPPKFATLPDHFNRVVKGKRGRVTEALCTAVSVVMVVGVGCMAFLLSPHNKSTHHFSPGDRTGLQALSLATTRDRADNDNTDISNAAAASLEEDGGDETAPRSFETQQSGSPTVPFENGKIAAVELGSPQASDEVSVDERSGPAPVLASPIQENSKEQPANSTNASQFTQGASATHQRQTVGQGVRETMPVVQLQSAIRDLFIRSTHASYRELGISTQ
jgi:hypothetical protein